MTELCQKYGIAELSVFGSIARGDERPDSDVDLLYARLPGNDLGMSYFALQEDLELLLGEIASALPDLLRDRYPDVAWRQIRAFRNLAVHKYFSVDRAVV